MSSKNYITVSILILSILFFISNTETTFAQSNPPHGNHSSGIFQYNIIDHGGNQPKTVTIAYFNVPNKTSDRNRTIVIPAKIHNLKVTKIGRRAFYTFPSRGHHKKFTGGLDLSKAIFLEEIETLAFGQNEFSGNIVLPESLKIIGDRAFYSNKFSGGLILPINIESIGVKAFNSNNFNGSLIFETRKLKIIEYGTFGENHFSGNLFIPYSITLIKKEAFKRAFQEKPLNRVHHLTFKDSETSTGISNLALIDTSAFESCKFRGMLNLPPSLKKINKEAFKENDFRLNFTANASYIGEKAFKGNSFSQITFTDNVRVVGKEAFTDNQLLKKVIFEHGSFPTVPNTYHAFDSHGHTVARLLLLDRVFNDCDQLADLELPCDLSSFAFQGNDIFHGTDIQILNDPTIDNQHHVLTGFNSTLHKKKVVILGNYEHQEINSIKIHDDIKRAKLKTYYDQGNLIYPSCITNIELPIELSSFNVEKIDNTVHLKWITEQEINNNYFIIERSFDHKHYEVISDTIYGAGNSATELVYNFVDEQPKSGIAYYRLKQVDFDGNSTTWEENVSLGYDQIHPHIIAYPNPASGSLHVNLGDYKYHEAITFELIEVSSGKEFKIQSIDINNSILSFDISNFENGVYILFIKRDGDELYKDKILVTNQD